MNPIRSLEEVKEHWDIFDGKWKKVFAFFLYTKEDRSIAQYVREYFMELDRLSGNECLIFLIDKPSRTWEDEAEAREYWNEFKFKTWVWEGFEEVVPYDKSKTYEIADFLGLSPSCLPCIVFFRNLNERDLLIYPLDISWSDEKLTLELRELFSTIKNNETLDEEIRTQKMWDDLELFIKRKNRERKIYGIVTSPLVGSIGNAFSKLLRL